MVGWCVLLERLESGLLLFETPQGLLSVELSLWQRAYLLWTFRNFRRLSLPLLNSRQAAMVRSIAQKNPARSSRRYEASLVIGVVENFKLPMAAAIAAGETRVEVAPAKTAMVALREAETVASIKTVIKNEGPSEIEKEPIEQPVHRNKSSEEHQPKIGVPAVIWSEILWLKSVALNIAQSRVEAFKFARTRWALRSVGQKPEWLERALLKVQRAGRNLIGQSWQKSLREFSGSQFARAAGVAFLLIGSIVAWHRMGAIAGSEAHSRPSQMGSSSHAESPLLLNAPEIQKTSVVQNSPLVSSLRAKAPEARVASPSTVSSQPTAADEVKPAAKTEAITSLLEQPLRAQDRIASPEPTPLGNDILATRPPLRSWYPDYSGIEAHGVVVLTAEVDSEGMVRSVRVVRGNRALAAAAVRTVRQWRYAPYFQNGKPVATETNIVISVFADDAVSMSFPPSITAAP